MSDIESEADELARGAEILLSVVSQATYAMIEDGTFTSHDHAHACIVAAGARMVMLSTEDECEAIAVHLASAMAAATSALGTLDVDQAHALVRDHLTGVRDAIRLA